MFAAFGIDWRLLIINIVNFGLLLAGLWYFLYAPITRMLEERRERVAEGMRNAQAAAEQLAEVEATRGATLAAAGQEADTIVSQARASATQKEREILAAGESAAERMLTAAEAQAAEMKAQAIQESKQEVAKLIVLGVERAMVNPGQGGK